MRELGAQAQRAIPARRPGRARPRLHPRAAAADVADREHLVSAARCAGWATSPTTGPVLLVGNHSGGNMTPDTIVFTLAFSTYFGVERALLPARPQPRAVDAGARLAAQVRHGRRLAARTPARRSSPAPRCSSIRAATTRSTGRAGSATGSTSTGRKGFIRLALEQDVPIVPVVSIGGQETALFLTPRRAARPAARARPAVPAQGAADLARAPLGPEHRRHARPHPAPGQDHDRDAAADRPARASSAPSPTSTRSTTTSMRLMQETLDALAAERRFPVIG